MIKQPATVSMISIVVIVIGGLLFVINSLAAVGPGVKRIVVESAPEYVNIIVSYLDASMLIIGGILALCGNRCGRIIVVGWCVLAMFLYGDSIIPRIVYLIIIALMFFNKKANHYYRTNNRTSSSGI